MKPAAIFDVGNVILPFDPMRACRRLAELCGITADEICAEVYGRKLEREFEEGSISDEVFTQGVTEILGIDLSAEQLRPIWADIFDENMDVSQLVRRIRKHHRVMLLSNTNAWHWEFAADTYPIIRDVPEWILSYEVGALKPDPIIYQAALEKLDGASMVIFVDDIEANVQGARKLGMTGVQFQSCEQIEHDLVQLGVNTV